MLSGIQNYKAGPFDPPFMYETRALYCQDPWQFLYIVCIFLNAELELYKFRISVQPSCVQAVPRILSSNKNVSVFYTISFSPGYSPVDSTMADTALHMKSLWVVLDLWWQLSLSQVFAVIKKNILTWMFTRDSGRCVYNLLSFFGDLARLQHIPVEQWMTTERLLKGPWTELRM